MSRNVLITTLPLSSNYGGILQAYALQRVVRDLGFRPVTDTSRPLPLQRRLRRRLWSVRRRVRMLLPARLDWDWRGARVATALQRAFIARHITGGSFVERAYGRRGRMRLAKRFRTFVVGSDQVWRAAYADIPAQFLEVVEPVEGAGRPRRISYAASFGLDDIAEYSDADRSRASELIRRFDAVSVRESSGVRICREEFGVHAERHLDPTMLLSAGKYRDLVASSGVSPSSAAGRMLVYRLDENEHVRGLERALHDRLGLAPLGLLPPPMPQYREYAADPDRYRMPSVEHWLSCFASAEFVVTDSFHGCAFSILFNRPFVVFANEKRGATRFDTLLSIFGLEHHLASPSTETFDERVFAPDWVAVNRVLDAERVRAISYLRANL